MEIHDAMLPMLRDLVVAAGRRIWNQSDFFSTLNKLLTYEKRKWIFLPASLGGILRARPDARLCTRPDPLGDADTSATALSIQIAEQQRTKTTAR